MIILNHFNTPGSLAHSDQNHTGGLRMSGGDHDDQSQDQNQEKEIKNNNRKKLMNEKNKKLIYVMK